MIIDLLNPAHTLVLSLCLLAMLVITVLSAEPEHEWARFPAVCFVIISALASLVSFIMFVIVHWK